MKQTCIPTDLDRAAILAAIFSNRGGRHLRQSLSSADTSLPFGAYFVWRLARFYGGADTCLPVMAYYTVGVRGSISATDRAFLDRLDALASEVATSEFDSQFHAAATWGRALGYF